MTPMLAVSPLVAERARHNRINGTRIARSDDNVFVSDENVLFYRFASHQCGPEGDHFRCARSSLIRYVRNARDRSEHARHELRSETRIDLALIRVAHSELHEHLAGLACRKWRM